MKEVVQVKLENEMDLILAHKRTMKLGELTGLSLTAQTSIATAVSEIARCAIEFGKESELVLGIGHFSGKKYLQAIITDSGRLSERYADACSYAKRLIDDIEVETNTNAVQVILKQQLNFPGIYSDVKVESFAEFFRKEPPLSSYDEIRKKNLMLQDLADKIQESENDYRTLTDSLPLLMFSVNGSSAINYTNKWLQDFLGSTPREFSHVAWKQYLHPDDLSDFSRQLDSALKQKLPFNGQFRFTEKTTGNSFWHLFSAIPLKNEKESVVRWIGFMVDIHAQKLVEQTLKDNQELKETQKQLQTKQSELEQKIEELNRSNYELEQFAYVASHDLQEPLRKVLFYSDVLKTKYLKLIDSAGVKTLNNLAAAALRMRELITDLLGYSQLQHHASPFEAVNLNELFRDILQEFEITVKEKDASFTIGILPTVHGSRAKLRQLFQNIISNSLKYSKNGRSLQIEISSTTFDNETTIAIKDNGIGFDNQQREKIFGLFQRLHAKDKYPGTGIGLSVCKKIAELHGGKVTAYSLPDEWATFEVTLPINKVSM